MNTIDTPGIFESVQTAIKPLVPDEEFIFRSIEFGTYYGAVNIWLSSGDFEINFHCNMKADNRVNCHLKEPSTGNVFISRYLFPALNLPISLKEGKPIPTPVPPKKYTYPEISHYLLERTGLLTEINRLCTGMKNNLPDIRLAFNPDNLKQTICL